MATGIPLHTDRSAYDAEDYPTEHTNDTDTATGIHHTLGTGADQSAAGDHSHALDDLTDVDAAAPSDGDVLTYDDGSGNWVNSAPSGGGTQVTVFSVEGVLATGAKTLRIYNITGATRTITKVMIAANTAPVGSAVTVDIHKDGVTLFTTQGNRPSIADGANTGQTTTVENDSWAADSYLTMEIDAIGSGTAGSDLTVHILSV